MARTAHRLKPKRNKREFPYAIEVAVPPGGLGRRLDAMHEFHDARGIYACVGRGHGVGDRETLRWYFTDAKIAAAFAAEFGGWRV